jgi:hypothetical protein
MLNRLSIRQKLTAMLMIASAAVLLLASTAFVIWDFYRFRADMQMDLSDPGRPRARQHGGGRDVQGS